MGSATPYGQKKTRVRGADNKEQARHFMLRDGVGQVKGAQEPSPIASYRYGTVLPGTRIVRVDAGDSTATSKLESNSNFVECDPPKNKD